jgi:biopolymer transport protein ExbB
MFLRKYIAVAMLAAAALAEPAQAWDNDGWAEKRKITLNAPVVRGLTQEVRRAPVLVRLHSGVLDFTKVKKDGSDLRFLAGDDQTPLNYHIERFDPVAEIALVWVDVPQVAVGANQDIWLYYGNDAAKPVSNPAATYDGEQALVLHFGENTNLPVDATANSNRITTRNVRPTLEGAVGGGMSLAADSQIRTAPSASLAIHANGKMTWSAWVRPAAGTAAGEAAIFTKLSAAGEAAPVRLTIGLRGGVPFVRLAGANAGEALASALLPVGSWSHLAVTADEGGIVLYVNGAPAARFDALLPELDGEEFIGAAGGLPGFVGDIDEIGRANTARSPSYIALLAQSQSRASSFAAVASQGEPASGAKHDYLRVLVTALTPDAWSVIAVLGVMMVLSWFVMITKAQYLSRVAGANRRFLAAFESEMASLGSYHGLVRARAAAKTAGSSLAVLFDIAQQSLAQRLGSNGGPLKEGYVVSPQSVAAIRSAMDTGQVRQLQRLNKGMVLLTIAIAGGPFIGLLGTVIGVMITFASVAASGEVNVTAIAPGIAAALLATTAGLAVAIPALFGYNYLVTQVEAITADNQVFVDELEKRIAETYSENGASASVSQ